MATPATPPTPATLPTNSATEAAPPPAASADVNHILEAMRNASTWGHPDQFGAYTAMRLYSEGHYEAAINYFKYGARYGDKFSQLSVG